MASSTISKERCSLRKMIFAFGTRLRICFAASIPFRFGKPISNTQTDIQYNEVWLQFFTFLNSLNSIQRFANDLQSAYLPKPRTNRSTPSFEIINHKDRVRHYQNFLLRLSPRGTNRWKSLVQFLNSSPPRIPTCIRVATGSSWRPVKRQCSRSTQLDEGCRPR